MDSLTQIALGAAVGEATLGRKVGNKAPLWGAIGGTIPDLDVIPGQFLGIVEQQLFHRGFTHSIVFFLILSPLLAWLVTWLYRNKPEATFRQWSVFFFLVTFTHALLDCMTTWGTQLFWPLDYRVDIHSIFVIDPLYTLPLLVTLLILLFFRRTSRARWWLNWAGLGLSTLYMAMTLVNMQVVSNRFEQAMQQQGIDYLDYRAQPAPINNILWSVTAETEDGYYIGFYSLLDNGSDINFHYVEKNHDLLEGWRDNPRVQLLTSITNGYFTVERAENGIYLNDLRFGQPLGWQDPKSDFVFSYHITGQQEDSVNQVQITKREGELKADSSLFSDYWARIKGV